MKRLTIVAPACAILLSSLYGQNNGSITGTVKDPSGATVADATATASNPATSVTEKASSNNEGIFIFPQLAPGTWSIKVEKTGFRTVEKNDIALPTAGKLNAGDFILQVGGVSESITIEADQAKLQVQTESGERSDLVTNKQIVDLAINGRNVLDLTRTIPGIIDTNQNAQSTVTNAGGTLNINGTRSNMHEIAIDGATNINTGNNSGLLVTINPDAVSEVKVLTSNYQAEYGRAGGGYVQMSVKSGTNQFHGGLRYFRRHDSLNADSFFNNANNRPRNIYRYNFWGYDIGGPVPGLGSKGDRKLFFFWSQEFYRQLIPQAAQNIQVPTLAERNGDFSQSVDGSGARYFVRDPLLTGNCNASDQSACFPGNRIPQSRFYGLGQAILNLYPQPNVSGRNDYNYTSQVSSNYPRREDIVRMDYNLTAGTRLSARMIRNSDEQDFSYGTTSASWNWPLSFAARANGPGYTFGFTVTNVISPTLINELNYAPSLGAVTIAATTDAVTRTKTGLNIPLLYPNANAGDVIPNFTYGGTVAGQTFPTTAFNGSPFSQKFRIDNIMDNLTKVWGNHVFKTGIYIQYSQNDRTSFTNVGATVNFANDVNNPLNTGDPYGNALLGIYSTYDQANNKLRNNFVYKNVEGYIQDTYKLTPRLTLDYGMRFSWYQPLYDQQGQLSFFNPALYSQSQAVRIYTPVCVNNAAPCSGSNRRAVDPSALVSGFVPTAANTQPSTFIGLIVPNSGNLSNGIGQANKNYPAGGFNSTSMLLSPRFGFAWNVNGTGSTVIRGGFGITYDRIRGDVTADAITNPPNVFDPTLYYGQLSDIPNLRSAGGTLAIPTVVGLDENGKLPTVYTYSIGIQRSLGWGTTVDAAYVGTQGRHLARIRNLNAIPYGTTFTRAAQDATQYAGGVVPAIQPGLPSIYSQAGLAFTGQNALPVNFLRPYAGYGDIGYRSFDAISNYHALQLGLNRRFSKSLTFGVAYTWSKTLTDAQDETTTYTNAYNIKGYDYMLANFDRSHVFVFNYVYNLPGAARFLGDTRVARIILNNWQLSGITQFVTGTPTELTLAIAGVDAGQRLTGAYSGVGNLAGQAPRFFLTGNPSSDSAMHVNPSAFLPSPVGSIGPYSRSYLRNPSWTNHDVSLFKNIPLGKESRYLQLRLEAFNVFNHAEFTGYNLSTNLSVPNGTDASGNQLFITGAAIFNDANGVSNFRNAIISNNIRGQRKADATKPLGTFFGELNATRDPRIVELAVKFYF